jgi:hypothetical protein
MTITRMVLDLHHGGFRVWAALSGPDFADLDINPAEALGAMVNVRGDGFDPFDAKIIEVRPPVAGRWRIVLQQAAA